MPPVDRREEIFIKIHGVRIVRLGFLAIGRLIVIIIITDDDEVGRTLQKLSAARKTERSQLRSRHTIRKSKKINTNFSSFSIDSCAVMV